MRWIEWTNEASQDRAQARLGEFSSVQVKFARRLTGMTTYVDGGLSIMA